MAARCQVCDGPIVNGRCKLCGMPYRKDEELYHLNEDRSEHYRHANTRVRQIMREQDTPILDRMQSQAEQRGTQQTQSRAGSQQRNSQQTQSRAGAQQTGQKAQSYTGKTTQRTQYGAGTQRTTQWTTRQTVSGAGAQQTIRQTKQRTTYTAGMDTGGPRKKKSGSRFLLIIVIFMLVSILSGIYSAWEESRDSYTWSWEDDEEDIYDWNDTDTLEEDDADESDRYYMTSADAEEIMDGEDPLLRLNCGEEEGAAFDEGTYLAHIEDGFGVLVIEDGNSISSKTLSRYSNNYVFSADGDETFRLTGSGDSTAYVEFYQID